MKFSRRIPSLVLAVETRHRMPHGRFRVVAETDGAALDIDGMHAAGVRSMVWPAGQPERYWRVTAANGSVVQGSGSTFSFTPDAGAYMVECIDPTDIPIFNLPESTERC